MGLGSQRPKAGTNLIFSRGIEQGGKIQLIGSDGLDRLPQRGWSPAKVGMVEFWRHEEVPDIICDLGPEGSREDEIIKLNDALYPIYADVISRGGLPLHSALVARDGRGALLAGRGNTGKSTCCQRILRPWMALCDDEALVLRTGPRSYNAHPFPTWSNFLFGRPRRAWEVQQFAPLKAIYFLEQAKRDEALPLDLGEAASRIYYSCFQVFYRLFNVAPKNEGVALRKEAFGNACEMSKAIPSFILKVDLNGRFWEEIDRTLDG
jgi:SynChlorMet cassette protein ScmC